MEAVTRIIYSLGHQHLVAFAAMRIMAGSASDLHVAKLGAEHMRGALEDCFSDIRVASKTCILCCKTCQHFLLRLRMVLTVTGQAAHILSVMFASLPGKCVPIH